MPDEITPEVFAALEVLRNAGFAVCAFTPTELRGVRCKYVEEAMTECGWGVIDTLADDLGETGLE